MPQGRLSPLKAGDSVGASLITPWLRRLNVLRARRVDAIRLLALVHRPLRAVLDPQLRAVVDPTTTMAVAALAHGAGHPRRSPRRTWVVHPG